MNDDEYHSLLTQRFAEAPVVQHLSQRMTRLEIGRCEIVMAHDPRHAHGGGALHGGVLMALLDNAAYFAAATQSRRQWVATAEMNVRLLESTRERSIRAVGTVLRAGKHLIHAEARAYPEGEPRLLALATGTWAVLPRAYR
ncbi:MAG: PaaI family thioesterase [Myxococcota bacterium]